MFVKKIIFILFCLPASLCLTAQPGVHGVAAPGQAEIHGMILSAQEKDSLKDYDGALKVLDDALAITHSNDTVLYLHSKIELEKNDIKAALHDADEAISHTHKY